VTQHGGAASSAPLRVRVLLRDDQALAPSVSCRNCDLFVRTKGRGQDGLPGQKATAPATMAGTALVLDQLGGPARHLDSGRLRLARLVHPASGDSVTGVLAQHQCANSRRRIDSLAVERHDRVALGQAGLIATADPDTTPATRAPEVSPLWLPEAALGCPGHPGYRSPRLQAVPVLIGVLAVGRLDLGRRAIRLPRCAPSMTRRLP